MIPEFCGVICANFGIRRVADLPVCKGAWCAGCFKQDERDAFPVLSASDLDDFIEDEELVEEEPNRFKTARDGDHLLTPFQCDCCHFVNIHMKLPSSSKKDQNLLLHIRQAILDSFWSRESSTVKSNLYQLKNTRKKAEALGVESVFLPQRGPFPVEDAWGMLTTVLVLLKSLDPGRNSTHVQYQTVRKFRSALSNFCSHLSRRTGRCIHKQ